MEILKKKNLMKFSQEMDKKFVTYNFKNIFKKFL